MGNFITVLVLYTCAQKLRSPCAHTHTPRNLDAHVRVRLDPVVRRCGTEITESQLRRCRFLTFFSLRPLAPDSLARQPGRGRQNFFLSFLGSLEPGACFRQRRKKSCDRSNQQHGGKCRAVQPLFIELARKFSSVPFLRALRSVWEERMMR